MLRRRPEAAAGGDLDPSATDADVLQAQAAPSASNDSDFVEESGKAVERLPWILIVLGAAVVGTAVWMWVRDEPTTVTAQITRVTTRTRAPAAGRGGLTTVDSTTKVVAVANLEADDRFKLSVLRGIAQPKQVAAAADSASGGSRTTSVPAVTQTAPPSASTTPTDSSTTGATTTAGGGATTASAPTLVASDRSETLTLSLLFVGALFVLSGTFYSRVTSLEVGPTGIKMTAKALQHLQKGVLAGVEENKAKGAKVDEATAVAALVKALRTASAAGAAVAGRPGVVDAASGFAPLSLAGGKRGAAKTHGRKVVLSPETLEEIGRRSVDSTLAGNPDFE